MQHVSSPRSPFPPPLYRQWLPYRVLHLPDGARHWSNAADGLPLPSAPGLTIMPSGRVLYAATYGRSAFRLHLPPAHRHREDR